MVVEDDKLVRKSLIQRMNWEKFNMCVVAEAKNGEKALDELNQTEVDLIITDLAMPIMSGIDLIREVRKSYPHIFIVVLTLHRDFEYIQEVMRLGAIDYIAKVELDDQTMDKTLQRIHTRVEKELDANPTFSRASDEYEPSLFLMTNKVLDLNTFASLKIPMQKMDKIHPTIVQFTMDVKEQNIVIDTLLSNQERLNEFLVIRVNNRIDQWLLWKERLIEYKDNILFYELSNHDKIRIINENELIFPPQDLSRSVDDIQTKLLSLEWVNDIEELDEILDQVNQVRIPKMQLNAIISLAINECSRVYSDFFKEGIHLKQNFQYWSDVVSQMHHVHDEISSSLFSQSLSPEANQCITKAINIIDKHLSSPLTANDVAMQVNMSRSYFSVCFKNITGHTFNEYIRIMRIDKAKNYLVHTNLKIGVIAENVGYRDIKYFSKLFKQETGMLPTEYRKKYEKSDR